MALIFGNNAGNYYLATPPVKLASTFFQGRRRVITDSVSFAVNTVNAGDDIVVARMNAGSAIYDWRVFVGTALAANATLTLQWSLLNEEADAYFAISDEFDADELGTTDGFMIRLGDSPDTVFGQTGPIATSIPRTLVLRVIATDAPLVAGNIKYSIDYSQD